MESTTIRELKGLHRQVTILRGEAESQDGDYGTGGAAYCDDIMAMIRRRIYELEGQSE